MKMIAFPSCRKRLVVWVVVFASLASPVEAEHFDVYVLTGQSNSLGTTAGGETDPSPGTDVADAATRFFWANASTRSSNPNNIVLYGGSGGRSTALQVQQGDGGANATFWGPEIGFGRTLYAAGHRNVLIVKASRGGGGNSNWIAGSGHMYSHVVHTVEQATQELVDEGNTFELRALLYLQGESDSSSEAAASATRLADLAQNLRNDLPAALEMDVIVGGIAADSSNDDLVRARQRLVPTLGTGIYYFSNLDLRSEIYDGLHFGRDAKLVIGERFASTVLSLRGESPIVENAEFDDIVDLDTSETIVIEDYVADANGATNGPNLIQEGAFTRFTEGKNPLGLILEAASGQLVFADYRAPIATSDIAVGPFGDARFPDSGASITLTFVNPEDTSQPAAVSRVGFRIGATNQNDEVSVEFFDATGERIHTLATIPMAAEAKTAFIARNAISESETSIIHQVRLRTNGPIGQLWAFGSFDDQSERSLDIVYSGSSIPGQGSRPADANADGTVDVSDAISLLLYLFVDRTSQRCSSIDAATQLLDVNGDSELDIADASYLLRYLFDQGPAPAQGDMCLTIEDCSGACS